MIDINGWHYHGKIYFGFLACIKLSDL
uniref:Uncharacterized protein n=1 Tax=Arundo donax TaxID=35708 RepID=A0A0A8ZRN9_ARUDO